MENNKAYLVKIHWIFLLALGGALWFTFLPKWLLTILDSPEAMTIILDGVYKAFLFVGLAIITGQWKKAALTFFLNIILYAGQWLLYKPNVFDLWQNLLIFLLIPLPLVIFIVWQSDFKNRSGLIYLLVIVAHIIFHMGAYSEGGVRLLLPGITGYWKNTDSYVSVLFTMVAFITTTIFMAELINYAKHKGYSGKTRLLNLGNDYPKRNSLAIIWALKLMSILLLCGTIDFFYAYSKFFSFNNGFYEKQPGLFQYFRITCVIDMLSFIVTAMLLGWYLRKFLLEYFITYNIRSKFLYWFSLMPFIGFLSLLIAQVDTVKQYKYNERLSAIGSFAASSTKSITAIFFTILILRIIFLLDSGEPVLTISPIVNMLLFIWMTSDKTGYYVNIALTILLLLTGIILLVVNSTTGEAVHIIFGLMLLNLAHLVLIFPVYHFEEFEYIPAKNPDPDPQEEFGLFKENWI
jgi:hypothetical protein